MRARLLTLIASTALGLFPISATAQNFEIKEDNAKLQIGGFFQFRYLADFRDDQPTNANGGTDDDFTHGFIMRRAKISLRGDLPGFEYRVTGAFRAATGTFFLEEAWGRYKLGDEWSIRAGSYKPVVIAEEIISSTKQLMAERSVFNEFFTHNFSTNIELAYRGDGLRLYFTASDGFNAFNTRYNSIVEADLALSARFEITDEDSFSRFSDFTSWRGSDFGYRFGGAVHFETRGNTNPSAANTRERFLVTSDLMLEGDGWNAYLAGTYQSLDTLRGFKAEDIGFVAQAGYFITDQTELAARYDAVFFDTQGGFTNDRASFITVGMNHYFLPESHAAKFTADIVYSVDETDFLRENRLLSFTPNGSTGLVGQTDEGEILFRAQMLIIF